MLLSHLSHVAARTKFIAITSDKSSGDQIISARITFARTILSENIARSVLAAFTGQVSTSLPLDFLTNKTLAKTCNINYLYSFNSPLETTLRQLARYFTGYEQSSSVILITEDLRQD